MRNDYCTKSKDGLHVFSTNRKCEYCGKPQRNQMAKAADTYKSDVELQDAIDEAKRSQGAGDYTVRTLDDHIFRFRDGVCVTCGDANTDMVNAPPHYNQAGIECIDAIAAATSGKSGIEAVCVSNVVKYLWRYELKNGVEDVKKARWYLDRLIGELEK